MEAIAIIVVIFTMGFAAGFFVRAELSRRRRYKSSARFGRARS